MKTSSSFRSPAGFRILGIACLAVSPLSAADEKAAFHWTANGDAKVWKGTGAAVEVRDENWESPRVEVQPGSYYRLTFRSRGEAQTYWGAIFEDATGEDIAADSYDSVDPGEAGAWQDQTTVFRTDPEAARMFLRVHPGKQGGVELDNLLLEQLSPTEARIEIDQLASELPLIPFVPPLDRFAFLPKTLKTLQQGGDLRIVMLGDSICNDTSQSLYELLLMDALPDVSVEVITSVRGSTGAPWYQEEGRVEEFVLRHQPDLLIIAGISHGYDVEAIQSVIQQVREKSDAEILVLHDSVPDHGVMRQRAFSFADLMRMKRNHDEEEVRRQISRRVRDAELFAPHLRQMCQENEVALFDIRTAWDDYLVRSGVPQAKLMRDPVHANRYGKQVAGRLLYRYLVPSSAKEVPKSDKGL